MSRSSIEETREERHLNVLKVFSAPLQPMMVLIVKQISQDHQCFWNEIVDEVIEELERALALYAEAEEQAAQNVVDAEEYRNRNSLDNY